MTPWRNAYNRAAALFGLAICLLFAHSHATAQSPSQCLVQSITPGITTISACDVPADLSQPEASARNFLAAFQPAQLKVAPDPGELAYLGTQQGLGVQHIRFQQMLAGYPIYGATVSVQQDFHGSIRRAHISNSSSQLPPAAAAVLLSQAQAEQIAGQVVAAGAKAAPAALNIVAARVVWYPRKEGVLTLAWQISVTGKSPLLDVLVFVDAMTGSVLSTQDRLESVVTGKGKAFRPNPIQGSGDTTLTLSSPPATLNGQLVNVDLPGLDPGSGFLSGIFVDLATLQSPNHPPGYGLADEPTRQYFYDRADLRFAQVNAYFALDSLQRFVRVLGYNSGNAVPNGIRSYPTLVNVHWDSSDNSAYSPASDSIHFGDGGVPDAEDADIMVHEFGHAIQQFQNPNWGCATDPNQECDMRAMGEGFSDYLAAAFHAGDGNATYQATNAACVGEWDSTAYSTSNPPCLRRVDGTKVYPTGLASPRERHKDGEIWSRALWDIRAAIGTNVATQIILEHHYSLPADATMPMAALEMIAVDAMSFGGVNEATLRTAFCNRGILSGTDCNLSPHGPTLTFVPSKDSFVGQIDMDRNQGMSPVLRVQGIPGKKMRPLLGFDLSGVDRSQVKSAVLELAIALNDQQWGQFGRPVDVHPLQFDFVEGNGIGAGAPNASKTPGTGHGVTWDCPDDTDISNTAPDCASPWWGGRPVDTPFGRGSATPPFVHTNGMTGPARWDVTSDVKGGVSAWAVLVTFDNPGLVDYWSKEGAPDATRKPHLILTFVN